MRIAMGIEYDGSQYMGWQAQKHTTATVQHVLEQAVGSIANHPVTVHAAGRTDAGVHGLCQVVHFDTSAERSERSWVYGSNTRLPDEVAVLWARPVADDFHARFKAERRRYLYVILNRPIRPTFLTQRVTWDYRPLDIARMQTAAAHLIGEHDFNAYRTVHCQAKHAVRHLHRLDIERRGDYVLIHAEADGFLHHMVRNIAGVLSAIGAGEKTTDWSQVVLASQDRNQGGVTAPPHGLYFAGVRYPEEFDLPSLSQSVPVW